MDNVILIGMPGCGKSTIGVVLAKVLGYEFTDSDLLIQKRAGKLLREIIAERGEEGFLALEGAVNAGIQTERHVIATGGSVVYSKDAMQHFQKIGRIVYLKLSYATICSRLGNIRRRGVVLRDGQSLKDLYDERTPLYEQYADIIVDAEGYGIEELMEEVAKALEK
ncbi:MAG: shikimate kinase [Bacteroides sp.]|nr:shikimate kinase [Bacteroides sp.]MCM1550810.1 shikimate kinase [Clostridium sp.]